MKLSKKLTPIALTVAMATGASVVPGIASAEVSASVGIANMYLWRGQNLTPDAPQVQGGIEYSNESGIYGGVWMSNEHEGHETDLYLGYGGEASGLSYDISYWHYLYPEDGGTGPGTGLSDTALSEFVLGLGYADVGFNAYISSEDQGGSSWVYYTLDYTINDFNILFGAWDFDEAGNEEYTHLTLTYAYTENLTFGVSLAQEDTAGGVEEDPLFLVSYNIPLDMK